MQNAHRLNDLSWLAAIVSGIVVMDEFTPMISCVRWQWSSYKCTTRRCVKSISQTYRLAKVIYVYIKVWPAQRCKPWFWPFGWGWPLLDPQSLKRLLKQQSTIRSFLYCITGRTTFSKYILFHFAYFWIKHGLIFHKGGHRWTL